VCAKIFNSDFNHARMKLVGLVQRKFYPFCKHILLDVLRYFVLAQSGKVTLALCALRRKIMRSNSFNIFNKGNFVQFLEMYHY
jgi:hypothetical protein